MTKIPKQTRSKQIKLKCMDCSGDSKDEAKFCVVTDCPLWHFRLGKNPDTVAKNGNGKDAILMDKSQFEEGGLFDGAKTAIQARKLYEKHVKSEGV